MPSNAQAKANGRESLQRLTCAKVAFMTGAVEP